MVEKGAAMSSDEMETFAGILSDVRWQDAQGKGLCHAVRTGLPPVSWAPYVGLPQTKPTRAAKAKAQMVRCLARLRNTWDVLRGEKEAVEWDSREDLW